MQQGDDLKLLCVPAIDELALDQVLAWQGEIAALKVVTTCECGRKAV